MIAVCGIGSPSGRRNSAVTANQSASAPTMPASAAARTYPSHSGPPFAINACEIRKMTVAPSRKLVATSFIRRRSRRLASSSTPPSGTLGRAAGTSVVVCTIQ